jgi:hypothetical protein
MLKKALLAAAAITAASMGSAHAETTHTRFYVCKPITMDNGRDPIVQTDISMQATWRPNGTVSNINWSVAHRSQHGATFYREQQYTNLRWGAYPSKAIYQWTGHLDGNYPVFMTGEIQEGGDLRHPWVKYTEYLSNMDHPWEGTRVVSTSACTDGSDESQDHTPPPSYESHPRTGIETTVTEGLHLRERPSANSTDMLGGEEIPEGTVFTFPNNLNSCRPANNGYLWCPLTYTLKGYVIKGWVSAYYLRLNNGQRVACYLRPHSEQCADVDREASRPYNQSQASQETQPYTQSPPTMQDAPRWLRR